MTPSLVPGVLAATFGLVSGPGSETVEGRLSRFLASRSLALVIDNVEQVLRAAPLPPPAPGGARPDIVTTSRTPLRVAGEQEFLVPPLAVPPPGQTIDGAWAIDAIRLFEDRAARVRPGYRLGPEDVEDVAEICRRLDGLPLGIEIAASRMALLPARDIAGRLGRRLDLPGAGSRDAPSGSGRSRPPSPGATTCCAIRNAGCSSGCRSSPAASACPKPRPSPACR